MRQDDPKFRALLMRREQGHAPPDRLWPDGEAAPIDGREQDSKFAKTSRNQA